VQIGERPNGILSVGNRVAKVLTLVPEPLPLRLAVQVRTRLASAAGSSGDGASSTRPCQEANLLGADFLPDFTRVALAYVKVQKVLARSSDQSLGQPCSNTQPELDADP
jgi:hypothetical protein